jgi:hypothetical protein
MVPFFLPFLQYYKKNTLKKVFLYFFLIRMLYSQINKKINMKNLFEYFDSLQRLASCNAFLIGLCLGAIGALVLIITSHSVINRRAKDDEQE